MVSRVSSYPPKHRKKYGQKWCAALKVHYLS